MCDVTTYVTPTIGSLSSYIHNDFAPVSRLITHWLQMERKASTARSDLEQMLVDETIEPKALPLSLLKDITNDFSDDREIGTGGFAVVYKVYIPILNHTVFENSYWC